MRLESNNDMDLIVATHVLPRRDATIHESGHYVIGQKLGMPVQRPVIDDDRKGGFVRLAYPKHSTDFDHKAFIAAMPRAELVDTAIAQTCMLLAGHAAEARLCRSHWAQHYVIGDGTTDLDSAISTLKLAGLDDLLFDIWQMARGCIDDHWPEIYDYAQTL